MIDEEKLYAPEHPSRFIWALGEHYFRHVSAMTREALHVKGDIAAELAWRDQEIERLTAALAVYAKPENWIADGHNGVARVFWTVGYGETQSGFEVARNALSAQDERSGK